MRPGVPKAIMETTYDFQLHRIAGDTGKKVYTIPPCRANRGTLLGFARQVHGPRTEKNPYSPLQELFRYVDHEEKAWTVTVTDESGTHHSPFPINMNDGRGVSQITIQTEDDIANIEFIMRIEGVCAT